MCLCRNPYKKAFVYYFFPPADGISRSGKACTYLIWSLWWLIRHSFMDSVWRELQRGGRDSDEWPVVVRRRASGLDICWMSSCTFGHVGTSGNAAVSNTYRTRVQGRDNEGTRRSFLHACFPVLCEWTGGAKVRVGWWHLTSASAVEHFHLSKLLSVRLQRPSGH